MSREGALERMSELERKHGTHGLGMLLTTVQGSEIDGSAAQGVRVGRILPGGVADKDGRLLELDKILFVNGIDVSHMNLHDAANCLSGIGSEVCTSDVCGMIV